MILEVREAGKVHFLLQYITGHDGTVYTVNAYEREDLNLDIPPVSEHIVRAGGKNEEFKSVTQLRKPRRMRKSKCCLEPTALTTS